MGVRMTRAARRSQVLEVAAEEFAAHGLHGASVEAIAREAGITQAYVFRLFGTKKALFRELVEAAFDRFAEEMAAAAAGLCGRDAMAAMGLAYYEQLADRTTLLLQLQGFAACGDDEVRDLVRERFERLWRTVATGTGLDPVTVKTFLAFGMLLNSSAAMDLESLDAPWARGVRTRVRPGLFDHITKETNR